MAQYYVGDRLLFTADYDTYNIRKGDTAEVVAIQSPRNLCVRFDRDVDGHDCWMPDLIPSGHGWWLGDSLLDLIAQVIDETDVLSVDLEEIL